MTRALALAECDQKFGVVSHTMYSISTSKFWSCKKRNLALSPAASETAASGPMQVTQSLPIIASSIQRHRIR